MAATLTLNAVIAGLGLTLIVGACLRWKWLVDPPIALVPQTWLKERAGMKPQRPNGGASAGRSAPSR